MRDDKIRDEASALRIDDHTESGVNAMKPAHTRACNLADQASELVEYASFDGDHAPEPAVSLQSITHALLAIEARLGQIAEELKQNECAACTEEAEQLVAAESNGQSS